MDPESSQHALIISPWQPVYHVQNQVVLYNSTSKALTIASNVPPWHETIEEPPQVCPFCHRPLDEYEEHSPMNYPPVPNYFHLLALHNESRSRPLTPPSLGDTRPPLGAETMAEGYFDAFFREEYKLGMGANGSVFLCQHVLDGNPLGHFAVKKIAVGSSHDYLVKILREVRLLETLRHQNIITYHHSWLESCRFSSFGPAVPTLFVLMQWAEGGSLGDFISSRQGNEHGGAPQNPANPESEYGHLNRAERIAAFRERTRAGAERVRTSNLKAVHLLSPEEIISLFGDIVAGLAFLHDHSILHLDLKPENVLLTWDTNALIPRAMLSDFGAARDMLHNAHARTGITGTLEYTAPEILVPDPGTGQFRQMDSKSDVWSLGIILHKLIYFTTPYHSSEDFDTLQAEVLTYSGFHADPVILAACARRGLPSSLLHLLETLLDRTPGRRPSCERVLSVIQTEKLNYSHTSFASSSRTNKRESVAPSATNSLVRAPESTPENINPNRLRIPSDATNTLSSMEGSSLPHFSGLGSPPDSPDDDPDRGSISRADPHPSRPRPGRRRPGPPSPPHKPETVLPIPRGHFRAMQRIVWHVTQLDTPGHVVKLLKAALLMGKIVTLAQICGSSSPSAPMPRSAVICVASALAALDMWNPTSGIGVSMGLAALHAGLLYFIR